MKKLLTLLVDHPSSWAFANPVNAQEAGLTRSISEIGGWWVIAERSFIGHGLL